MAESSPAPNNKSLSFGIKPQREPAGVTNSAPMKAKKSVRKTAKRAMKRGLISEKAAKRHLSGV